MIRLTQTLAALATAAFFVAAPTAPVVAQNLFTPVVTVNGSIITGYEIQQRALFLQILRTTGDLEEAAEKALIDERIQSDAARRAGVTVSEDELAAGMAEFAARASLETDAFVAAIAQVGVSEETFRAFVLSGLLWRNYVQARFGASSRVTDAELDQALERAATQSSVRARLAEVILSTAPENAARTQQLIDEIKSEVRNFDDFTIYARRFSLAPTRLDGGLRDWVDLSEIPETLAQTLLTLSPGQVTDPVPVGENAVALFQLRGLSEIGPRPAARVEVDYITVAIPGGRSPEALAEATRLETQAAGDCDRLFPIVRGEQQDRLTRQTVSTRSLPGDLALAISNLDPGESTSALTRNNGSVLLFTMLCGRAPVLDTDEARGQIQLQVFNQRLTSLATGHLEELKAKAFIERR